MARQEAGMDVDTPLGKEREEFRAKDFPVGESDQDIGIEGEDRFSRTGIQSIGGEDGQCAAEPFASRDGHGGGKDSLPPALCRFGVGENADNRMSLRDAQERWHGYGGTSREQYFHDSPDHRPAGAGIAALHFDHSPVVQKGSFLLEGRDPIDEKLSVEMVVFMENDTREKTVSFYRKWSAFFIECLDSQRAGSLDDEIQAGKRKAAFLVFDEIRACHDNFRVYKGPFLVVIDIRDENALGDPNLGSGEADPMIPFHRIEHFFTQNGESFIELRDRLGFLL